MGNATKGVWKTTYQSGCSPREACADDQPLRSIASMARERHLPDVQYGLQRTGIQVGRVGLFVANPWSKLISILITCNRPIAFLKQYSTQCARQTAQDAVQIFGGRGITQSGMGKFIEHVRSLSPLKLQCIIAKLFSPSITVPSLLTRFLAAQRTY